LEEEEEQALPEEISEKTVQTSQNHETVLLVDDEPIIVESMQEALEDLGYCVLTAKDGKDGLEVFKQHKESIGVLLSDVVMPKMGGIDMFRAIRELHVDIPTIFMTGYDNDKVQLKEQEKTNTLIVSKPIQIYELSTLLREVLEKETA